MPHLAPSRHTAVRRKAPFDIGASHTTCSTAWPSKARLLKAMNSPESTSPRPMATLSFAIRTVANWLWPMGGSTRTRAIGGGAHWAQSWPGALAQGQGRRPGQACSRAQRPRGTELAKRASFWPGPGAIVCLAGSGRATRPRHHRRPGAATP